MVVTEEMQEQFFADAEKKMSKQIDFLRSLIDGAYDLETWHLPNGIMKPPHVAGRFMLHRGALSTVLHNRVDANNQTTLAMYGHYTLTEIEFAYCYDEPMSIAQTSSGISVSTTPMWEGMRTFSVASDAESVRLQAKSGQGFLFTKSGLKYFEKNSILRTWTRFG